LTVDRPRFLYFRCLWAAILGRTATGHVKMTVMVEPYENPLRRGLDRLIYAARMMELPMAFADDIAALDKAITDALAAKDQANQSNVDAVAAANSRIGDLEAQIAQNDQQLQQLIAKYAPPTPSA